MSYFIFPVVFKLENFGENSSSPIHWESEAVYQPPQHASILGAFGKCTFTQALTTLGFLLLVSVDTCFANWQNPCCSLFLTSCKFTCAVDIGAPHLGYAVEISLCPVYSC